jgi:hypothetical protein
MCTEAMISLLVNVLGKVINVFVFVDGRRDPDRSRSSFSLAG